MATGVSPTNARPDLPQLPEATALAAPQVDPRSTMRPVDEAHEVHASWFCDCLWDLLGSLWELVVRIFGPSYRETPERAALRERTARERDALHAENQQRMAERAAQTAEWTRIADDVTSFEARLAQIESQIDQWKQKCDMLAFPCMIACKITIQPPSHIIPYRTQVAKYFDEQGLTSSASQNKLEEFKGQIRTVLETSRAQYRRSLINFGHRSYGYQLPESTITLSLVYVNAALEAEKFDGAIETVTVGQPDAPINLIRINGKTLIETNDLLSTAEIFGGEVVHALLKLARETT